MRKSLCLLLAAGAAACAPEAQMGLSREPGTEGARGARRARATLRDASDREVAQAELEETAQGLRIRFTATALPPGARALHIHESGRCKPDFAAAGAHFNPHGRVHGLLHPAGHHAGDLPNIIVEGNGGGSFVLVVPGLGLSRGGANSLFDADGSSLVVHEKPDDGMTDPAGGAGDRIACGAIEPVPEQP